VSDTEETIGGERRHKLFIEEVLGGFIVSIVRPDRKTERRVITSAMELVTLTETWAVQVKDE